MKKLMVAAAVAAMTAGAFAGECGEDPETPDCKTVFTVKFSGKTATEYKDTYKTAQKISAKGYLLISPDYVQEKFSTLKVGSDKYENVLLDDGEVVKMTYFGKKLDAVLDENVKKPGKTYSLESDLRVQFADQTDATINIDQVAFGKVKVYVTKDKTIKAGKCGEDVDVPGCVNVLTPVSYSGWFTGDFTPMCLDEEGYFDCCNEFDADGVAIMGGTWSAKYDKRNSIAGDLCEE